MGTSRIGALALAASAVWSQGLWSCGTEGSVETHFIEEVRVVAGRGTTSAPPLPLAARFGFEQARSPRETSGGGAVRLAWELPRGWRELPAQPPRLASFSVAGEPDAECSLVVLAGTGGGVLANVDRWRAQMGLDPLPADASPDELPRGELLGAEAIRVDLEGTYSGMGAEPRAGYRLVGLIAATRSSTAFLKMTGPADVLEHELEAFERLARSFAPAEPTPVDTAAGLRWTAPADWQRAPQKPMRLVTYSPKEAPETECYLVLLPGDGGGLQANVDRWRSQLGLPPANRFDAEASSKVRVLGTEATLVELGGDFTGMDGEQLEGAALLAVVCDLGTQTLFVKMTGPADQVRERRGELLAFCASLAPEEAPQ